MHLDPDSFQKYENNAVCWISLTHWELSTSSFMSLLSMLKRVESVCCKYIASFDAKLVSRATTALFVAENKFIILRLHLRK